MEKSLRGFARTWFEKCKTADTITKPGAFTRKAANNNPKDGSRKKKSAIEERVEKETS